MCSQLCARHKSSPHFAPLLLLYRSVLLIYSLISCCVFQTVPTSRTSAARISYFIAATRHDEGSYLRVAGSLIFLGSGGWNFPLSSPRTRNHYDSPSGFSSGVFIAFVCLCFCYLCLYRWSRLCRCPGQPGDWWPPAVIPPFGFWWLIFVELAAVCVWYRFESLCF